MISVNILQIFRKHFVFILIMSECRLWMEESPFPGCCAYTLVLSQDTVPLLCGSDILKVCQKSDNLMFRFTVKVRCIAIL